TKPPNTCLLAWEAPLPLRQIQLRNTKNAGLRRRPCFAHSNKMSIFLPMLIAFQNILRSDFNRLFKQKLLVAVSGGCDSMVLCELLRQTGLDFAIAHCNFRLRGDESDADETFVEQYATKFGLKFFSARWDAHRYATDRKLSIQEGARELRYAWFFELMHQQGFEVLLTAHHADDNLETF